VQRFCNLLDVVAHIGGPWTGGDSRLARTDGGENEWVRVRGYGGESVVIAHVRAVCLSVFSDRQTDRKMVKLEKGSRTGAATC
jgi:hypothetical protein